MEKPRGYNLVLSRFSVELFKSQGVLSLANVLASKNRFYPPLFELLISGKLTYRPSPLLAIYLYCRFLTIALIRVLVSYIYRKSYSKKYIESLRGKDVFLLRSFLMGKSFKGEKDAFFGSLSQFIKERGKTPVFFVENLKGGFYKSVDVNEPYIEVYDVIDVKDLIWIASVSLKSFLFKGRNTYFGSEFTKEFEEALKDIAHWEKIGPSSLNALLFYRACLNLEKKLDFERYIYPYENNSWERMALLAFAGNEDLFTIGYQHNVIPPSSLNMFPLEEEIKHLPQPDIVITTGKYTKYLLARESSFPDERIKVGCALRYEYLYNSKTLNRNLNSVVLVALEGVGQVDKIINRLRELAFEQNEITFLFRFHPVLPYEKVQEKLDFNMNEVSCFEISSGYSVYDDLARSSVVLYWGSTLGLEAVKIGRPVINVELGNVSFDPLFELESFKRTWHIKSDNLLTDINEFINMDEESYSTSYQQANHFIKSYFHPVNSESIEEFFR